MRRRGEVTETWHEPHRQDTPGVAPGAIAAQVSGGGGVSPGALRKYGLGAQILGALGITEMILLTNSPMPRVVGLEGYGLSIVETRGIAPAEG